MFQAVFYRHPAGPSPDIHATDTGPVIRPVAGRSGHSTGFERCFATVASSPRLGPCPLITSLTALLRLETLAPSSPCVATETINC